MLENNTCFAQDPSDLMPTYSFCYSDDYDEYISKSGWVYNSGYKGYDSESMNTCQLLKNEFPSMQLNPS